MKDVRRNQSSTTPTQRSGLRLFDWAIGVCLLCLLGFIPGCDFINDLIGGGGDEGDADGGADGSVASGTDPNVPQPPPLGIPGDAAAAAAEALKKLDGGALPPGITGDAAAAAAAAMKAAGDAGKLPPGIDPTKLPPGVDPADLASGKLPPGFDPSKIPPGTKIPEGMDPSKMPPVASGLTPELQAQLAKALASREKMTGQINRLNYVIDRNLTKNPADAIKLQRLVRARRELDYRLNRMAKEHNIPREMLRKGR